MKSSKYILISLAAIVGACLKSVACGPYAWYNNNQINRSCFEIVDWSHYYEGIDNYYDYIDKNILEWQKMVGENIEYRFISEVVYDFTLSETKEILNKQANLSNPIFENTFVKYLRNTNDTEIVNYLLLAKRCELTRPKWVNSSDKWWYPNKEDIKVGNDLQSIIDEALAYKGKRLKDRYLLQALRAAFSMENYNLCFSLWKNKIAQLPNSEVKKMCAGYIGKILFQQKNYGEAIKYYALTDEYDSFFWCVDNMTNEDNRTKMLNKYKPSSPELAKRIQDVCREAESGANKKDYNEYKRYYLANRKRYIELRDLALKAAKENRNNNPAMWQYAAAFLTFLDGDTPLANQYLNQAAGMKGTAFVKNSISNFRVLANAYATAQSDSLFESLLPELKTLDNVKSKPFEKYSHNLFYSDNSYYHGDTYKEPSLWWYPSRSLENSFMENEMTKITPARLIPNYLALKDYTKVLLLAMAANTWTITDKIPEYYSVYCTDVYFWMDVVPVENVIEFQQLYNSGGRTGFERFLLARCRIGNDFLNELIGTKYLRTAQFEKAIPYLSKVSTDYIKKMNIYRHFTTNPFQEKIYGETVEKPYLTYKLSYAKRMLALQSHIQKTRNREEKAKAMLQYALALKRSAPSGESWTLTDYFLGATDSYNYNALRKVIKDEWHNNLLKKSDKYLEQAATITKNQEMKAQCYLVRNYSCNDESGYNNSALTNANYRYLIKNYHGTQTVKQFMSECDNFYSYYQTEYKKEAWAYNPEKNQ